MNIEKEVRFLINEEQYQNILQNTTPLEPECDTLDVTFGYDGFNSLKKFGFVCRVRKKKKGIVLEIKKKMIDGWLEQEAKVDTLSDGINFFSFLNMTPYMYLYKKREIRKYKDLKIFIDKVELLGNFVEIEYQDCLSSNEEVAEFKAKVGIDSPEEDLYGNIIMEKLENDMKFKESFENNLKILIDKERR